LAVPQVLFHGFGHEIRQHAETCNEKVLEALAKAGHHYYREEDGKNMRH